MKRLSLFFNKFKEIVKNDEDLKNKICLVVQNNIGLEINKNNILIKNKTAYIKENPHLKSEVFMKKEKILTELQGIISDIR